MIEPNESNDQEYEYDRNIYIHATGNCVFCENPEGEPYVSSYDSVKNEIVTCDLNGDWSKFRKNKNGEIIGYEDSDGNWFRRDCNEEGQEVYFENSDGHWRRREYDQHGYETYFERDDGYWCERKNDENGNEYYYKDSESLY